MNCRAARSNPPPGPAVKLATLAGRRGPRRRRRGGAVAPFVSKERNLGRTVCLGKGCEWRTSPSNQLGSYAETAWLGRGWRSLARARARGYVSQCAAVANSHDSCAHDTSVCRGGGGGGGEKLAYGQSQSVTFGLEFTLGSDAHTDELVRTAERRRRV